VARKTPFTVVYYGLVQPGRPVVLPPGQRWQSVWQEQADVVGDSPEPDDRASAFLGRAGGALRRARRPPTPL